MPSLLLLLARPGYCGPCGCSCEPAEWSEVGAGEGSNPVWAGARRAQPAGANGPRPYGCEPPSSSVPFPCT
jgi:hypothetical protein